MASSAEQMSLNRIDHTCNLLESIRDTILNELYKVTELSEIDGIASLVSDSVEEIRNNITIPFRDALIDACREIIDYEDRIGDMQRDYDDLERTCDNLRDEIDDLESEVSDHESTISSLENEISELSSS